MNEKIKRLLFTEKPFFDESFIGYILRLAELNKIPDIRWILELIRTGPFYKYSYRFSFDYRINISFFSQITGVNKTTLRNLLYCHQHGPTEYLAGNLIVFDQLIRTDLVCRETPKICPLCLAEQNYCRKIWELSPVTACPIHRCLLLDFCPTCQRKIDWTRPLVNLCSCEYDFRDAKTIQLAENEWRLSKHIHQAFGLLPDDSEAVFNYPLKTLSLEKLLKLLYFGVAFHRGSYNYKGENIALYLNNRQTHESLTFAAEIFDNRADSYYKFIEAWVEHSRFRYSVDHLSSGRFELPGDYAKYEPFNRALRDYLIKRNYPFLFDEFIKFLKTSPIDSEDAYLLDYL